ncbi:MAG: helix-hairpin-helix domain-containing protein [Verrucomicrobiales bacterium]
MRHLRVLLALALSILGSPAPAAEPLQSFPNCVRVDTEWADGDSFLVRLPDRREFTFRLYGVDCFEIHLQGDDSNARRLRDQRRYFGIADIEVAKDHGKKALAMVKEKLSRPFTVHSAFADGRGDGRFKRFYAFVTTADGEDLASWMVGQGLARAFGVNRENKDGVPAKEYEARLQDLELAAAKLGRGAWADTNWAKLPEERQQARAEAREIDLAKNGPENNQPVDPNTAAKDELAALPGVGEILANRIIAERVNGRFEKPDDLLRVEGIGEKTLARFKDRLVFAPTHPVP